MEIVPPECRTEPLTPCIEKDWVQCAECARYVCLVHDELITVHYSGKRPTGTQEVCPSCITSLFEAGEISMGEDYCYINHR
jgi:hypothetical protein